MRKLSVDLETFSSVDIKSAGMYRYMESPDFRIMLIAYAVDDGPVQLVDLVQGDDPSAFLALLNDSGMTVHAYNAAFELLALSTWIDGGVPWVTGGYTWPALLSRMRCTMAQGLYCGYPAGLAAIGEALGLPQDKRKLSVGNSLIKLFCSPQVKRGFAGTVTPQQEPEKWELFRAYCMQDVETERAVARRLAAWPMPEREQKLWEQDCLINLAGVQADMRLVPAAVYCGQTVTQELMDEAADISGLQNPRSVQQLTRWLDKELPDEPNLTDLRKDTVTDLLARGVQSEAAERMLTIRQQLGKTSTKKYDAIEAAAGCDSRVRGLLQYYGASRTGRWAGRLVQIQNLPRNYLQSLTYARELVMDRRIDMLKLIYGNVPDTLSQLIRTAFVPRPGHALVIADYSAIEARVLAWLAGERWVMDVFAGDGRIYEATAAQMFGVPVNRIVRGRPEYELRQNGKVATLALGYGGSTGALIAMGAMNMGLTEAELPDLVERWRNANPRIVACWREIEDAAMDCVQTGLPTAWGVISFRWEDPFLVIALPSGRALYYAEPQLTVGKFGGKALKYKGVVTGNKWGWINTFGGKLVENIVQAIARDCLAELLVRLRFSRIVFHVHDEVVLEETVESSAQTLASVLDQMAQPIAWAPGLVLRGDGFVADDFYRKD